MHVAVKRTVQYVVQVKRSKKVVLISWEFPKNQVVCYNDDACGIYETKTPTRGDAFRRYDLILRITLCNYRYGNILYHSLNAFELTQIPYCRHFSRCLQLIVCNHEFILHRAGPAYTSSEYALHHPLFYPQFSSKNPHSILFKVFILKIGFFYRVTSDISVVLRETTLTIIDSIETGI